MFVAVRNVKYIAPQSIFWMSPVNQSDEIDLEWGRVEAEWDPRVRVGLRDTVI